MSYTQHTGTNAPAAQVNSTHTGQDTSARATPDAVAAFFRGAHTARTRHVTTP